jgi:3-isopropylmalate/(R)-2-methylmalate dehydratase small subunit
MSGVIEGRVWCFGDHVDTDAIIPARYCNMVEPEELAQHCLEDADPTFPEKVRRGDLVVAGENFGCGSSREVAPITLKGAGIGAVIAKSFARIFFRNSINIGLPIFECHEGVFATGDHVTVDPGTGVITNVTQGTTFMATPFPPFLQEIIAAGGLPGYVQQRLYERA